MVRLLWQSGLENWQRCHAASVAAQMHSGKRCGLQSGSQHFRKLPCDTFAEARSFPEGRMTRCVNLGSVINYTSVRKGFDAPRPVCYDGCNGAGALKELGDRNQDF